MANWEFLPNPGREEEGLGHAGIETFKASPYTSIARESSQNSLDAAARESDGSPVPVHLIFRHLSVPASEIPGISDLRKTFQACLLQAKTRNLKKDKEFFERAVHVAAQSEISVLCVEDYGTTGLIGPAVAGKPFHALVKSSGVSQKTNADAGGSFGIGKNAAFAISSLRTVFYSTLYAEGEGQERLTQGKSVLVSHDVDGGTHYRATGYWGNKEFMPAADDSMLPNWLKRQEVGTTVASIGFVGVPDWHWQMVEALVRNFFSAINSGAIHFTVQWETESLEISSEVLESLFDKKEVRDAAESAGTTDDLDFSKAMLCALKAADAEISIEDFKDVGTFRMTLLQQDGFPRRMGILRNGMYVADNLKHFNHPMARFPMSRDFVAVLEPHDRKTSGQVRDMESPRHDEISAERIDDLALRKKLKTAMKKVGEWIRSTIKSVTTKPAAADVLLDEMNRFFSKPSAGQPIPDPANRTEDPEKTRIQVHQTAKRPPVGAGSEGESGASGGLKPSKSKGGRTTGSKPGGGRGAAGGRGGKSIPIDSLRNSKSSDGMRRTIIFTPGASGAASLEISAVGVASDEALPVRSINGKPSAKAPRIQLDEGTRETILVEFEAAYHGPIEVVLTTIEEKADAC